MAIKLSKNNPDNKNKSKSLKMALSDDCINCKDKCKKGILYLERFAVKHEGIGVPCDKK